MVFTSAIIISIVLLLTHYTVHGAYCGDNLLCDCQGQFITCKEGVTGDNILGILSTNVLQSHAYLIVHTSRCSDYTGMRGAVARYDLDILIPKKCQRDLQPAVPTKSILSYLDNGLDYYDNYNVHNSQNDTTQITVEGPIAITSLVVGLFLLLGAMIKYGRGKMVRLVVACRPSTSLPEQVNYFYHLLFFVLSHVSTIVFL